jgi:hypothetical protein
MQFLALVHETPFNWLLAIAAARGAATGSARARVTVADPLAGTVMTAIAATTADTATRRAV